MLVLLSPAKTLDLDPVDCDLETFKPDFQSQAKKLVKRARELSKAELKKLMSISDDLASLNYERFKSFKLAPKPETGKPAILTFKGDVYIGLDAPSLRKKDLEFAQEHVRMLSGLYGVLRPLDRMQPYRLEMGSSLTNERGKNLYQFWGDRIAKSLKKELRGRKAPVVVNLASNEYFKAVDQKALGAPVVTPVFKEIKDGVPKVISFVAKRSRGSMTRHIIDNRITDPEELKKFDFEGYAFQPKVSTEDTWEFHRKFVPVSEKR